MSKGNSQKINIKPLSNTQSLRFWGIFLGLLLGYYYFAFGLESPFINLYGDYSNRVYYTSWGRVRQNVPLLPDKFVTLLASGGVLIQFLLTWLITIRIAPNPLTRLLWLAGLLALIPLGIYLLTYASLLVALLLIPTLLYVLGVWIFKGDVNK
jgi:hypothetical protein